MARDRSKRERQSIFGPAEGGASPLLGPALCVGRTNLVGSLAPGGMGSCHGSSLSGLGPPRGRFRKGSDATNGLVANRRQCRNASLRLSSVAGSSVSAPRYPLPFGTRGLVADLQGFLPQGGGLLSKLLHAGRFETPVGSASDNLLPRVAHSLSVDRLITTPIPQIIVPPLVRHAGKTGGKHGVP